MGNSDDLKYKTLVLIHHTGNMYGIFDKAAEKTAKGQMRGGWLNWICERIVGIVHINHF